MLRLYNAGAEAVRLGPDDVWLALGYAEDPPGPRVPAEGLMPFTLLSEQAADLTLTWRWEGEPFAALAVGDWRFVIQIER